MREVVEQEPLMLGLMFPQSHGAWTASLIPIETSIEWQYLETLALLADRSGLDYIFMGNGYYAKGGYGGIGRVRAAGLDANDRSDGAGECYPTPAVDLDYPHCLSCRASALLCQDGSDTGLHQ